jgi:microcin C transport system substrate-binding protein
VRFRFKPEPELPLIVGGMPVFSRKWGMENGKPSVRPGGDGRAHRQRPYKIGPVRFGKDITYVRDPNYWARDLNVRGHFNFDRITVKIYLDNTARLEA